MDSKRLLFATAVPLVALSLAAVACGVNSGAGTQIVTPHLDTNGVTAEPTTTDSTAQPVATQPPQAVDPTAACPQATAETQAYVSKENGFCFLVPVAMKSGAGDFLHPGDSIGYFYPPPDPTALEYVAAGITVAINAPAEGLDSAGYAKKWMQVNFGAGTGLEIKYSDSTVGGLPAGVVSNIPGQVRQQTAFVVANGYRYSITVTPQPGDTEPIDEQVNNAWNTVTGSIVFFAPSAPRTVVTPDSVCPAPSADTRLHVGELDGVCFLVPASVDRFTDYANGYQSPAILGDLFGQPLHAQLVLAFAGPAEGKTPRQLWEPMLVNQESSKMDVAGAQDTTLSGFPAIVWTEAAPLGSRTAIVVANDRSYTINNQPYNDPNFAAGQADVELMWQTVTLSLAFFTPFR